MDDIPYDNLYFFTLQIINDTSNDAPKNMNVKFSVEPGCLILGEHGSVEHKGIIQNLSLEEAYRNEMAESKMKWNSLSETDREKDKSFMARVDYLTRHKVFVLPILNRKNVATFNFLVVTDNIDPKTRNPIVPVLIAGIYVVALTLF